MVDYNPKCRFPDHPVRAEEAINIANKWRNVSVKCFIACGFFKHDKTVERYLFKISVSSTDVWIAPALKCRNEIGMCIGYRPLH